MTNTPWLKIWISPRKTISEIVERRPSRGFIWLSGIYGFSMLLQAAQSLSLGLNFSWPLIVLAALVFSVFVGMLGITIGSALLTWVGHWIGGKAPFAHVRAAVAWSNLPNIITCITWLILAGFFRQSLFIDGFMNMSFQGGVLYLLMVTSGVQLIITIWSFILLLKTLGQVQGFSVWKALLNVILPFFLMAVALWAVSWIIWQIKGF